MRFAEYTACESLSGNENRNSKDFGVLSWVMLAIRFSQFAWKLLFSRQLLAVGVLVKYGI